MPPKQGRIDPPTTTGGSGGTSVGASNSNNNTDNGTDPYNEHKTPDVDTYSTTKAADNTAAELASLKSMLQSLLANYNSNGATVASLTGAIKSEDSRTQQPPDLEPDPDTPTPAASTAAICIGAGINVGSSGSVGTSSGGSASAIAHLLKPPSRVTDLPKLTAAANSSNFKVWKDEVRNTLLGHGLLHYIDKSYDEVVLMVQQQFTSAPLITVQQHVMTQSSSIAAALQRALDVHWGRFSDMMITAAASDTGSFITNNVYWLWCKIDGAFGVPSGFVIVKLLAEFFQIKHNINDNPLITVERIMKYKRQLVQHKFPVDDRLIAAVLFYSLPESLETIKQSLIQTDTSSFDDMLKVLQRYYDMKINRPGTVTNNSRVVALGDGAAKAFTISEAKAAGICFHYLKGNCKHGTNGTNCRYKHQQPGANSNNTAASRGSGSGNKTNSGAKSAPGSNKSSTGKDSAHHHNSTTGGANSNTVWSVMFTEATASEVAQCTDDSPIFTDDDSGIGTGDTNATSANMFTDINIIDDGTDDDGMPALIGESEYRAAMSSGATVATAAVMQQGSDHLHYNRVDECLLDTGASRHVIRNKRNLTNVGAVAPIPMIGVNNQCKNYVLLERSLMC